MATRIRARIRRSAIPSNLTEFDAAKFAQRAWNGSTWMLVAPCLFEASAINAPLSPAPSEGITTAAAVIACGLACRSARDHTQRVGCPRELGSNTRRRSG